MDVADIPLFRGLIVEKEAWARGEQPLRCGVYTINSTQLASWGIVYCNERFVLSHYVGTMAPRLLAMDGWRLTAGMQNPCGLATVSSWSVTAR